MRIAIKTLFIAFAATLGVALVYVLMFVSPRGLALKNQKEVVLLLYEARPTLAPGRSNQIQSVALGDRVTLIPGRPQVAFGYKLAVAMVPSGFTITANPQAVGETGADSFFRDSAGKVRFEPELGKPATERSRLFSK